MLLAMRLGFTSKMRVLKRQRFLTVCHADPFSSADVFLRVPLKHAFANGLDLEQVAYYQPRVWILHVEEVFSCHEVRHELPAASMHSLYRTRILLSRSWSDF